MKGSIIYLAGMPHKRVMIFAISLTLNIVISCTILPTMLFSSGTYSVVELIEVLLWQGMAFVGWPLVILGAFLSFLVTHDFPQLGAVFLTLMYPAMLVLLVRVLIVKAVRSWELAVLHLLVAISFAVIWNQVLNGYDFMLG